MAASFDANKRRRPSTPSLSGASMFSEYNGNRKRQRTLPPSPPPELNPFNTPTILALERMFDRVVELAKRPSSSPSFALKSSTAFVDGPSSLSASLLSPAAGRAPTATAKPTASSLTTALALTKPQGKDTIAAFQPGQQQALSVTVRAHTKAELESSSNNRKYRYLHPPLRDIDSPELPSPSSSTTGAKAAAASLNNHVASHPPSSPRTQPSSTFVSSVPHAATAPSIPVDTIELIDSDDENEEARHSDEDNGEYDYDDEGRGEEEEEEELWIEDGSNDERYDDDESQQEEQHVYEDFESEGFDDDEEEEGEEEEEEEDRQNERQHTRQSQVVELLSSDDEPENEYEKDEDEEEEDEEEGTEEEEIDEEEAMDVARHPGSIRLSSNRFVGSDHESSAQEESSEDDDEQQVETELTAAAEDKAIVDLNFGDEPRARDTGIHNDEDDGDDDDGAHDEHYTGRPTGAVTVEEANEDFDRGHDEMSSTGYEQEDEYYSEQEDIEKVVSEEDEGGQPKHLEADRVERWPFHHDDVAANADQEEEDDDEETEDDAGEAMKAQDADQVEEGDEQGQAYPIFSKPGWPSHTAPSLTASRSDSASLQVSNGAYGSEEEGDEASASQKHVPAPRPTMWQRPAPNEPSKPAAAILLDDSDEEDEGQEDEEVDEGEVLADEEGVQERLEEEDEGDDEEEMRRYLDQHESDQEQEEVGHDHQKQEDGATQVGIEDAQSNHELVEEEVAAMEEPRADILPVWDESGASVVQLEKEGQAEHQQRPQPPELGSEGGYFEQLEAAYVQIQAEEEQELAKEMSTGDGEIGLPLDANHKMDLPLPTIASSLLSTTDAAATATGSARSTVLAHLQVVTDDTTPADVDTAVPRPSVAEDEEDPGRIMSPPARKTRLARAGTMMETIRDGNAFLRHFEELAASKSRSLPMEAPLTLVARGEGARRTPLLWSSQQQQRQQEDSVVSVTRNTVEPMEGVEDNGTVPPASTVVSAEQEMESFGDMAPAESSLSLAAADTAASLPPPPSKPSKRWAGVDLLVKEAREFCQSPSAHSNTVVSMDPGIRRTASIRSSSSSSLSLPYANRRRGSAQSDHDFGGPLSAEADETSSVSSIGRLVAAAAGENAESFTTPASTTNVLGVVDLAAERVFESAMVGNHALRPFVHPPSSAISPVRSSPTRFSPSSSRVSGGGGGGGSGSGSRSGSVERVLSPLGSHVTSASPFSFGNLPHPPPAPFPTTMTAAIDADAAAQHTPLSPQQPVSPFRFGSAKAPLAFTSSSSRVGFSFGMQNVTTTTTTTTTVVTDEHPASKETEGNEP